MRQGLLYIWMLTILNINGVVSKYCLLSVPENASVGTTIEANVASYCFSGGAPVKAQSQNQYFNLTGTQLMVAAPVRLENGLSDPGVGNGSCSGKEKVPAKQAYHFQCSDGSTQNCTITIDQKDDYPAFFCDSNCYKITNITLYLNESQGPLERHIVYQGKVCDYDFCGDNCGIDDLKVYPDVTIPLFDATMAPGSFALWQDHGLDYESSVIHNMELNMTLNQHRAKPGIPIIVHVLDVDDQGPAFTEQLYVFNITEKDFRSNHRTQYKVKAVDQDIGINAPVNYRVTSGFPTDVTYDVSKDGTIMIEGNLDREINSYYTFGLLAYEVGREKDRFNLTTVVINVMDIDDNPPQFAVHSADVEILENLNNGAIIYTPSVTDIDKGENAQFKFSINNSAVFNIDETTGAVSVKDSSALDRDKPLPGFTLQLTAQSTRNSTHRDTMQLHVRLKDVNDNTPEFLNMPYQKTIAKNASIQAEVLKITAHDADEGRNGKIAYSLVPATTMFSIDKLSGSITLTTSLRDTSIQHYRFFVTAEDNPLNTDLKRASWAEVVIDVVDINIHPPNLIVEQQIENITENNDVGIVVGIVNCTDMDWNDNLDVTVAGGSKSYFQLSKFGETLYRVTVVKNVDREKIQTLTLEVQCSDGVHNVSQRYTITVLDQNDNTPEFTHQKMMVPVPENANTTYNLLMATDVDVGKNGVISYSLIISDHWKDKITIDSSTGIISFWSLDREAVDHYIDLTVTAVDHGVPALTGMVKIKVGIQDQNDNPPQYEECDKTRSVWLEEGKIYTNFSSKAFDIDSHRYAMILYRYMADTGLPNNAVKVSSDGSVTFDLTNVDADGSRPNIYNITIEAYNRFPYSDPSIKNASQTFELHVVDVNDNDPVFINKTYFFTFNETATKGSHIGRVEATDKDLSAKYNTVSYSISGLQGTFRIDKCTGNLYLDRTIDLDVEKNNTFTFKVYASDSGLSSKHHTGGQGQATVTIKVRAVNDNAPEFVQDFSTCQLQENVKGNFNCSVIATDLDKDKITYNIVDSQVDFSIDTNSGEITSQRKVDYDRSREHFFILKISATDGLHTVYSMKAVELININDEAPIFEQANYVFAIKENNPKGMVIGHVSVTDEDSDHVVLSSDNTADFVIMNDGELRANVSFDSEVKDRYSVVISATDGLNTSSTTVEVHILDVNDNAPEFDANVYNTILTINESQRIGKTILTVTSKDDDKDAQNKMVSYSLQYGNLGNSFSLDPSSGKLSLQKTVNASVYQKFELVIVATDGGSPALSNLTTVTVKIVDENNNAPIFLFEPYEGTVRENYRGPILKVDAMDPDLSNTLDFQVVGKCRTAYNISFNETILYANYIDAESIGDNLTIVCGITVSDGTHTVNSSVKITVIDENDNKPVFHMSNDPLKINDTLRVGSHILDIQATDVDVSTRTEKVFFYLDENSPYLNYFNLDYITGELSVKSSLKQLSGSTIDMTVTARDAGSPPQESSKNITIVVKEVNANSPKFTSSPMNFNIKENVANFSKMIEATDVDGDMISYRIVSGDIDDIFFLDQTTGTLSLLNRSFEFDYETKSGYSLIVEATDNAHFPKSASVTVYIKVQDVNEAPRVSIVSPVVYRQINTTANNIITSVFVEDPDTNPHFRECTFTISPKHNHGGKFFSIDKNATITTARKLTEAGTFFLTIHVINLKIERILNMTVIVVDVQHISKTYNLREKTPVPAVLDQFDGNYTYMIIPPIVTAFPGMVNFTLEKNGASFDLVTWTQFDYEKMADPNIHFSVDGINNVINLLGQQIQVDVTVININDNPPEFNATHFDFIMYENATIGDCVGTVTANDADGTLTNLTYTTTGTDFLRIDPSKGDICLTRTTDFDSQTVHHYTFNVTCNDTKFTDETTIAVLVMDVNDNPPHFTNSSYKFHLDESMPVGVILYDMQVSATDKDLLDKGKLFYELEGSDSQYFKLDSRSGIFTLIQHVDFEQRTFLEFDVRVSDTAGHTDNATVRVKILDYNDHSPRFSRSSYKFTVLEGRQYSGQNFPIMVTDLDSGQNGNVTLKLDTPSDPTFELTQKGNKGFLQIVGPLDRENPDVPHINGTAIYTVTVVAKDHGNPPLSCSAIIFVYVEDVNDCPPTFSQTKYHVSVQEGVDIGQHLISVTTTDCDYNLTYTRTNFSLVGAGHDFQITNDGELLAGIPFDKEVHDSYSVVISASDGLNTASTTVEVHILDVNDNAPEFDASVFDTIFSINESQPTGKSILTVYAMDDDKDIPNNVVSYSLQYGNLNDTFMLNTSSGELFLTSRVNASVYQQFGLVIIATDGGTPALSNITTVTINIVDENDNAPIYLYEPYEGSVKENCYGQILQVNAVDPDLNDKLDFHVEKACQMMYNISFNETILYANYIDAESIGDNLTFVCGITVSDGTHTVNSSVTITVIDENDNKPVFSMSKVNIEIDDTLTVGSHILDIQATDRDVSTRTEKVFFYLDENSPYLSYFHLDYITGELSVQSSLKQLSGSTINMTVTARDAGSPPQESSKNITIVVKEVNVHPPEFISNLIKFSIRENERGFTKIIRARDLDRDKVSYRIVSGDIDDIFTLDQTTGTLYLTNRSFTFDYETESLYSLIVEATDNAHFPKSASVTVDIKVQDVNEAPRVHTASPVVYRKINTTANNIITSVIVEDPDSNSTFRQCDFSIFSKYKNGSHSVTGDLFKIDRNGTISTAQTLRYAGTFVLTVHVINIDIEQYLNLTVIVSNVEGISQSYNLPENTPVPKTLDHFGGNYTYTIMQPVVTTFPGRVNFTMQKNGTTFDLVAWTQFDFEKMSDPSVQFSIEGINRITNILEKQIQIDITVENVNDNPPVFHPSHFDFNMYENATKGEYIGTVTAKDADGVLTNLTYSIDGSDFFSIDPINGSVYLTEPLDFEDPGNHQYTFNVTCNDTMFDADAIVKVTLLDINDNAPNFTHHKYDFSISESLPVGILIRNMSVMATDQDSLDQGKLSYKLEGYDSQYFSLDQHTGMFTLAQGLDYEDRTSLEFSVIVSDSAGHTDNATVEVNILDVNDQPPRFSQATYNFTVLEGLTYETDNFTIAATDLDKNLNGQITLELRPHDPRFNLSQNGRMGFLHIVQPLDRENPEVPHINGTAVYTVTVVAADRGKPALSSSAMIHVYVMDVNDCPPTFSQTNFSVSVQEGVDIGQHLISVTTTDCDYNPVYTRTNFSLVGAGHESFRMQSTGDNIAEIVVAKKLSRTTKPLYNLTITATDGKNEMSVSLTITILDTNDHSPTFNQESYNFNVTEEKPSGLLVGIVSASDIDVGQNGNVTYKITSGNTNNTFEMVTNYSSGVGVIKTNNKLDREHQSAYMMIITAEDGAKTGRHQGTCSVTIRVEDINDNYPIFNTESGYTGTVMENSNDFTIVQISPLIKAEDSDYGSNGTDGIHYYLVNQTHSDSFHIDDVTGQVTVSGPVDRESTPVLHLTVIAEDSNGDVAAKRVEMNLTINVLDENDSPPEFLNTSYIFSIPENCDSHTSVGQVSVTDDDVSGVGNVQFRIIHGDDEKFYIETMYGIGTIRVGGNVDREIKDLYTLTVIASDGINEGNTTVVINIQDKNDNAPTFTESSNTVVVQENSPVPIRVCTVTATDIDQKNTPNSLVTYSIDDQSDFNITENGEIFSIASLDREMKATYKILVTAKDDGRPRMNSTIEVVIIVGDENDNSPQFLDETGKNITQKEVNIVEKSPVDSVVALILAKDVDYGANGTVVLTFEASQITKYFKIEQMDNSTAVVKIAQSVSINTLIYTNIVPKNSSESVTLDLRLIASDNGEKNTTKSSSMTLLVNIETINDATPVFLKPDQPLYVMENSAIGTTVGKCEAMVVNTTLTHLTYSLVDNRTENEFIVNSENCTILTASNLDREKDNIYNFPIMVKDGRTPERTAFTMIRVVVKDENDNVPVFYRYDIHLELQENMNYTEAINVSAVDQDQGNNAVVTYSLLNTYDGNFDIQNETGMLRLVQPMDYESYTNYTITVVATDHGTSPLNSTSTVYVSVIDINDNDPQFYDVNKTLHVQENYIGEISTIFANDSDSGLNGKVLFRISNSDNGNFAIDPLNGTLSVIKALDYEKQKLHTLEITATDLGDPPRNSTVSIVVVVTDVRDFVLSLEMDIYTANVSRSVSKGDFVIRVNASQPGAHYAISGSDADYFWIDKSTGVIYVSQPLENQRDRYILYVTATTLDDLDTVSSMVIITVVDHLFLFPHKEYHVELVENVESALLFDLNATEEINNHEVSYEIVRTEPPADNMFRIDERGRIYSLKALDHETSSEYILYITAEPGHKRQKRGVENNEVSDSTTLVQIVVNVTDVNDNPPEFPGTQKQRFGVPREARAGYIVTTIKAEDKDSPIEGEDQILYKFVDNDQKIFSIQQSSGNLVVCTALSSVTTTEFNLTILAYDPVDINKNDTINIQIRVIENNERLLLVAPIPVDEFRKRQEELMRNMSMVLGIGIELEQVEAHKEIQNEVVRVSLYRSDLYFHGINLTTGLPLSNDAIMRLIDKHSSFLESLFGSFNVTRVRATKHFDSSAMGVPEIALISMAVFIFIGSVVAIVLACFTLKSDHASFQDRKDSNHVEFDDFELQPISSETCTPLTNGFINPAFKQEFLNKSNKEATTDKLVPEQALESQEIRVEFGDEQIDRNLPEAKVKENGVLFPSQRSKDNNVSLSSNLSGPSGSDTQNVMETSLTVIGQLAADDGPVMTSSPKAVRFKDVRSMKDTGDQPGVPENMDGENAEDNKTPETHKESSALVMFDNVTGETETDDAADQDGKNDDNLNPNETDINDDTPDNVHDGIPNSDKDCETLDSDIEEVTCF